MKHLSTYVLIACSLFLAHRGVHAQTQPPMLLEAPTVSRTHVAFSYAGDIWLVSRAGGDAHRVTIHPARETYPVFSPDGSQIAFTRFNVAGGPYSWDVFVTPTGGGEAKRLTYHPDIDFPINWTPDGKNVLLLSFRSRISWLGTRLYTIPAQGGFATEVPVPRGWAASYSADGKRIAYTPLVNAEDFVGWRNYRGGGTSRIWLVRLADGSFEAIPRNNSNDYNPMWIGDKVYFVSDRAGAGNLFAYDTAKKTVSQLSTFNNYGIKSASAGGGAIVFNQGGALHLFDLATNQTQKLDIRVSGDFPETKPRKINTSQWMSFVALSPDASNLLFGVRGEIFTANRSNGAVTNITESPAAVERIPVWSPDGKWIAYFSDESGEQQLFIRDAASGQVRRFSIEPRPSFYSELQWSPDSNKLVFSDSHLRLWIFNLTQQSARQIDKAQHTDGDTTFNPVWSPDSKWIGYAKYGVNRVRSLTLYSIDNGEPLTVTRPYTDVQSLLFDLNGKYLYFFGSNRTGLVESQAMSGFPFRSQVTRSLYAVVLNARDASPLAERVDSKLSSIGPLSIDPKGIEERIVLMPLLPATASRMMQGRPGTLFIVDGQIVHKFAAGKAGLEKFVEGAGLYRTTYDGRFLLFRRQGNWSVVPTDAPPKAEDGRFTLKPIELTIDPRAEWKQMYGEAWRLMREYYYDPNLHGQNFAAHQAHYAAYLPNVATREDLNLLFKEMFSHLSTSHLGVAGGEIGAPQGGVEETVGLLGADFEISNGRYRIQRIFRGDSSRGLIAPLARPGINVLAGEYLLAVDGEDIKADDNIYRHFVNKASKRVQLKIGPTPDGKNSRNVMVTPVSAEFELRQHDWVEQNRLRIHEMSGGRLGYVFLPDTADAGFSIFNREFYAQLDKQGIIVDGRFNGGGRAADYIIDTLKRVPLQRARLRDAEDIKIPIGIIDGPKVLLTNEMAGSGGDSLPWMWQQARLGPVVGMRTAGAGVGATTHDLLDRGSVRVPDWGWYDPIKGTWLMENRGVTPDYEIEIFPPDWRAGRDPQLDKAITLALDALKKLKKTPPRRPAYPIYK